MLSQDVERYSSLQRALGYKCADSARSLTHFATFAMAHGDEFVRVERVLVWAVAQTPSPQRRQRLVARVRRFALALQAENPKHEVPPRDCLGHAKQERKAPYIYTAEEIERLMEAAGQMPAKGFIAPATLTTLLGLLAATGLRISEALSLQLSDIGSDGLLIRKSKFGKSRLIPLHGTTEAALERYRNTRASQPAFTQAVFVSKTGQALLYGTVWNAFRRLLTRAGLKAGSSGRPRPRMHDLRHTFAVRSLEQCGPDRKVVAQHMVALSTYLGHTNVTDTYWYLEGTPILMRDIAMAGEARQQGGEA
jgi:integrase